MTTPLVLAYIPSPHVNGFHVGPLVVHLYGLMYVVAIVAAVVITGHRWQRMGGDRALAQEVAVWGVPAGLVGGRLYHVVTSWNEIPNHWWGALAVWQGGLGIWGGIVGGTLAGVCVVHRRGINVAAFMDAVAPGLLVAQAIGRIGNYVNQELFGSPTTLPWGLEIDPAHRPGGFEQYATFHPTFLYEIVWNLALAGALVWLGRRGRVRAAGLFALYVAGYSLGRIGEELLRTDPAHHILGMRLNFFVAAVLFVAGLTWFAWSQGWLGSRGLSKAARGAGVIVVGGAIAATCGCAGGSSTRQAERATASHGPAAHAGAGSGGTGSGDLLATLGPRGDEGLP
jgi:prolipoprotein diacylglyceryl transferase